MDRLVLPLGARVWFDEVDEARTLTRFRTWLESDVRRPGLHASDLIYPMLSYWKSKLPKPLTDRQVGLFAAGRALHAIHNEACGAPREPDGGSQWSEALQLWFSPDFIEDDGLVVELKTTRAFYQPTRVEDVYDYLLQLGIYMVARNQLRGRLRVWYLNAKNEDGSMAPRWRSIGMTWTQQDFEEYHAQLVAQRDAVLSAVAGSVPPGTLPLCPKWMCGDRCPWWDDCKPEGRYPKRKKKPGAKKGGVRGQRA